jgi:SsrA-binding protein
VARSTAASGTKLIAQNRRARHEFQIEETVEAGLVLVGTEVKSCREGKVNLSDAYAMVESAAAWLIASCR